LSICFTFRFCLNIPKKPVTNTGDRVLCQHPAGARAEVFGYLEPNKVIEGFSLLLLLGHQ